MISSSSRRTNMIFTSSVVLSLLGAGNRASAEDICTAAVVRDVPAVENPASILKKGQRDTAITQYRVNPRTGESVFCSHGGYCYPTHVRSGDDRLEALRLTNCRLGDNPTWVANGELYYDLEPIRTKIDPKLLRHDDIDNRFLAMGLCSACADNVTQFYISKPDSQCGRLARSAIEGNQEAINLLQTDPSYCRWNYSGR
jgi:hypothetical protein